MRAIIESIKANPLSAVLVCTIAATFVYFFGFLKLFMDARLSTAAWAWQAWNPETNYAHAKIIPLLLVIFIWLSRAKLKAAQLGSSRWGWFFLGIGVLLFLVSARTVQARLALGALPFLFYGIVLYVLGKEVARVLFFPIAFLFFMVPLNFLTQATFRLQFVETAIASTVCNLIGVHVNSVGTVVNSADNAFHFQVDEGCSGVHSLMAIAMLSSIYAHYTQDRLWKKVAILAAALLFALIGNAGRLVSIFAVARFFSQDLAGGPYHNISGYLTFPFAVAAMVLFAQLLNINVPKFSRPDPVRDPGRYDY